MSCISFWQSLIWKYKQRNYPNNIRIQLNAKYKSLHKHEKKIKNIIKHSYTYKLFDIFPISWIIKPKDSRRIKHHRYMINKIQREIDNIRRFYDS